MNFLGNLVPNIESKLHQKLENLFWSQEKLCVLMVP